MKKMNVLYAGLILGAAMGNAYAQLRVEISGVGSNQIPVAIATFADEHLAPARISQIVKADLERSGLFKIIDTGTVIAENAPVDYDQWKARGADALVVGSVAKMADGRYEVRYKLLDTIKSTQLSSLNEAAQSGFTRLAAHHIADDIYQKLTGTRGAFSARIAYVNANPATKDYRLEIADADGEGVQVAARSTESIVSPSWSPDGTKVAYVSIQDFSKPVIYVQDLVTGKPKVLVNEKGTNSGPAWSPDGRSLAVCLSKTGNTQIYVVSPNGGEPRRLTDTNGIDTEPHYSADGQWLYFTSDRSGGAQIYKMPANGGDAQRITFKGAYNISPRLSSDGKTLAWISQRDGMYSLYAMDLASGQELRLADHATEPSFSPNGKYLMYATSGGGQPSLAVVSVDGRTRYRLTTLAGNIKEPSWGPF